MSTETQRTKTMKTIGEKLEVMKAWLEGKEIEYCELNSLIWKPTHHPFWDWKRYDFRAKPELVKKRIPLTEADLPAAVWIKGVTEDAMLLVCATSTCFIIATSNQSIERINWEFAMVYNFKWSPDRKVWHPMWKEVV
jgi:hypothetical protein